MLATLVTWIWALIGSCPKIKSAPGRESVAYSGFIIPSTGKLWVNKPGWFTYETVISSIRDFLANNPLPEGVKYYMVMDNAPGIEKLSGSLRKTSTELIRILSIRLFLSIFRRIRLT